MSLTLTYLLLPAIFSHISSQSRGYHYLYFLKFDSLFPTGLSPSNVCFSILEQSLITLPSHFHISSSLICISIYNSTFQARPSSFPPLIILLFQIPIFPFFINLKSLVLPILSIRTTIFISAIKVNLSPFLS